MRIENIKFKAKSSIDGAWLKGDLIHKEDGKIAILRNGFYVSEVDPLTVCQFTGMKDNYGGEIYEHDIVKMFNTDGTFTHYSVIWNAKKCAFIFEGFYDRSTELSFCILEHYRVQIIGNKFDKKGGKA